MDRASVVEEIRHRLDIVDFIGGYVPLKKAGRNFKGLCPFHAEKTPSFIVFPESQRWHCFGACSTGGDLFNFVMRKEGLSFGEALRFLAERAGVKLAPRREEGEREQKLERLAEINRAAAQFFHNELLHSPAAQGARDYVKARGLKPETVEAFQLGYAPEAWQALSDHLRAEGYGSAEIFEAGLTVEREGGGYYDRFRGRLIFPIREVRGRTIGFGGRTLGDAEPKYLNSPQTPLFDKGAALYGIDMARGAIQETGQAVIVEGYMDVLTAHQNGFRNVVASMGTALGEVQLKALQRLAKCFYLALDADAAGLEATWRGLEVAQEVLKEGPPSLATPLGLIRYAGRLGAEVRVIPLPSGQDPDEVIKESPQRWAELLQAASPLMDWFFGRVLAECDLTTAQGKAAACQRLLPLLEEMGVGVQQRHYLGRLARLLKVDERTLWANRPLGGRRARGPQKEVKAGPEGRDLDVEEYSLAQLIERPELVPLALELGLSAEDFARAEDRELFAGLVALSQERSGAALEERREALREGLRGEPSLAPEEVRKLILRLRERNLRRRMGEVRFLQEDAEVARDREMRLSYTQLGLRLSQELAEVQGLLHSLTFAGKIEERRAHWQPQE